MTLTRASDARSDTLDSYAEKRTAVVGPTRGDQAAADGAGHPPAERLETTLDDGASSLITALERGHAGEEVEEGR